MTATPDINQNPPLNRIEQFETEHALYQQSEKVKAVVLGILTTLFLAGGIYLIVAGAIPNNPYLYITGVVFTTVALVLLTKTAISAIKSRTPYSMTEEQMQHVLNERPVEAEIARLAQHVSILAQLAHIDTAEKARLVLKHLNADVVKVEHLGLFKELLQKATEGEEQLSIETAKWLARFPAMVADLCRESHGEAPNPISTKTHAAKDLIYFYMKKDDRRVSFNFNQADYPSIAELVAIMERADVSQEECNEFMNDRITIERDMSEEEAELLRMTGHPLNDFLTHVQGAPEGYGPLSENQQKMLRAIEANPEKLQVIVQTVENPFVAAHVLTHVVEGLQEADKAHLVEKIATSEAHLTTIYGGLSDALKDAVSKRAVAVNRQFPRILTDLIALQNYLEAVKNGQVTLRNGAIDHLVELFVQGDVNTKSLILKKLGEAREATTLLKIYNDHYDYFRSNRHNPVHQDVIKALAESWKIILPQVLRGPDTERTKQDYEFIGVLTGYIPVTPEQINFIQVLISQNWPKLSVATPQGTGDISLHRLVNRLNEAQALSPVLVGAIKQDHRFDDLIRKFGEKVPAALRDVAEAQPQPLPAAQANGGEAISQSDSGEVEAQPSEESAA